MTIYLIRHGRTLANEQRCYCGSTDLPLSEAGRKELKKFHYALPGARYITSGRKRTEETLEILFGPVPHTVEPAFQEADFGIFEMHTYQELKDTPAYQAWLAGDNERNVPPGGESGEQMARRVLAAFDRILDEGRDTVIVTHGGVIAAIMAHLFPQEGRNRYQWQPPNGLGYAICDGAYRWIPE